MLTIDEEENIFEYGVFFSVRYSWELSSRNRGEAPDTEEIIKDILDEIKEEEYLAEEYSSTKEP